MLVKEENVVPMKTVPCAFALEEPDGLADDRGVVKPVRRAELAYELGVRRADGRLEPVADLPVGGDVRSPHETQARARVVVGDDIGIVLGAIVPAEQRLIDEARDLDGHRAVAFARNRRLQLLDAGLEVPATRAAGIRHAGGGRAE